MVNWDEFKCPKKLIVPPKPVEFDPNRNYIFEIDTTLGAALLFESSERSYAVIHFREIETGAIFSLAYFHRKQHCIRPDDPSREADIIRFARGIGYPVVIGGRFAPADFLKPGLFFAAKVARPGEGSNYVIDFGTVSHSNYRPEEPKPEIPEITSIVQCNELLKAIAAYFESWREEQNSSVCDEDHDVGDDND